jgi:hypothetical protein
VRKSIIIVLSVLVGVSFVHPLVAEVKKPQNDGVICDRKFDIFSQKGQEKLGAYSIRAVSPKGAGRIEISETMTLALRGKSIAFESTVIYADKDGASPLEGSAKTKLGGKICMTGTVKFSPSGKIVDYESTGHLDQRTGQELNPAKKYAKRGQPVSPGTLVFQSAIPAIGPRILPAEGEMEDVVFIEFPDDIGGGELINFKASNRLVRGKPDKTGQYDIKLFRRGAKESIASYRFDKNNQLVSMDLFGKFLVRPAKADKATPADDDRTGFVSLFNGKDLTGWDAKPNWWYVEDGAITSQTTPKKPCKKCNYLIWKGGKPGNFELRLKYKLVGGNSGIQFRSQRRPDWDTFGYQADMDAAGTWTGCVFAHARGKVAGRGTRTVIDEKGKKTVTRIGDAAKLLKHVKINDWNEYRIIAKGPKLTLMINGVVMCEAVDNEKGKSARDGIIALQVHPGPPMKVQFKDILLKKLTP